MRHLLILAAAALLAGCGGAAAVNDSAAVNGAAADGAVPSTMGTTPLTGNLLPSPEGDAAEAAEDNESAAAGDGPAGAGGQNRAEMLEECTSQARAMLPGANAGALCTCAVDRVLAGAERRAAVRQCAAQLNVRLPGG
jgi:hypothetical protein